MRFSFLLCIGRCKLLGLLESFLSYASRYLGPILLSLLFTYLFPVYHKRWLMLWMATSHILPAPKSLLTREEAVDVFQIAGFFFHLGSEICIRKRLVYWQSVEQTTFHFTLPRAFHTMESFLVASIIKSLPVTRETQSSIPGSGRSPGEGNGNSPQYSCLENSKDRRVWGATVWDHKELDTTEQLN